MSAKVDGSLRERAKLCDLVAVSKKKTSKNLIGLLVSGGLVVVAPFLGFAITVLFLRGAFRETATVDPSQRARHLAAGISLAMNGTFCGMLVSLLAMVPTVIFAVRLHRESRRERPQS